MKKIISSIAAVAVASTALVAGNVKYEEVKDLTSFQELKTFKANGLKVNSVHDNGSVYILKGVANTPRGSQPINGYLTKDKKVFVMGNGFYTDTVMDKVEVPVDIKQFEKEAAFTYGNGPVDFYVFTDPECPFCAKFEAQVQQYKNDATFHYFLFPLSFHPNAVSMSKYVMSQPTLEAKHKALSDISEGLKNRSIGQEYRTAKYSDAENKAMEAVIAKHKQIASELGVSGTPTVFDDKGSRQQWPNLRRIIDSKLANMKTAEVIKEVVKPQVEAAVKTQLPEKVETK